MFFLFKIMREFNTIWYPYIIINERQFSYFQKYE